MVKVTVEDIIFEKAKELYEQYGVNGVCYVNEFLKGLALIRPELRSTFLLHELTYEMMNYIIIKSKDAMPTGKET